MATLCVLIIEDSESDAELIIRQFKKAGHSIYHERIETADEMTAALDMLQWDIIISDNKLPQFNVPAALELLQKTGLDIPFIVVSGTIGEETAAALMRSAISQASGRFVSGRRMANSSPPIRAMVSMARRHVLQAFAKRRSVSSPTPCPWVSLTALK